MDINNFYKNKFLDFSSSELKELNYEFNNASPFKNLVIDNFLDQSHASYLKKNFPKKNHKIWLDWKKRSSNQYKKHGVGNSDNFFLLNPQLRSFLDNFNSNIFIEFLGEVTGYKKLIPDPYFTGGGFHLTPKDGFLNIHTDFNYYERLDLYRILNVIIFINDWSKNFGGELELWDKNPLLGGKCIKTIEPIFNRMVVFETNKLSFHGHPNPWKTNKTNRKSIALYFYLSKPLKNFHYDQKTNFYI